MLLMSPAPYDLYRCRNSRAKLHFGNRKRRTKRINAIGAIRPPWVPRSISLRCWRGVFLHQCYFEDKSQFWMAPLSLERRFLATVSRILTSKCSASHSTGIACGKKFIAAALINIDFFRTKIYLVNDFSHFWWYNAVAVLKTASIFLKTRGFV